MIDIHFKKFDDVAGADDQAKYQTLINQSPTGFIIGMNKYNGVFCEYDARGKCFKTKSNKVWREGFFPARFVEEVDTIATDLAKRAGRPLNLWGELWMPGTHLATIAGHVSVNSKHVNLAVISTLSYRVFDVYDPLNLAINFPIWLRGELLHEAFSWRDSEFVFKVPAGQIREAKTAADMFTHFEAVASNFEGMVYYIGRATQLPGVSHEIVKRTVTHTAEYKCVGVEFGLPDTKRAGRIANFVLQDTAANIFRVGGGPGLTQERLEAFAVRPPVGKLITISFKEYSINGVPLRPQFLTVRDYE
jgi:hypothetical protein